MRAVGWAVAAILAIALIGGCVSCQPQEQEVAVAKTRSSALVLDTSNAAQMHKYGMPTKADVMNWHAEGRWAYWVDGAERESGELPGSPAEWDSLYGIERDPSFVM